MIIFFAASPDGRRKRIPVYSAIGEIQYYAGGLAFYAQVAAHFSEGDFDAPAAHEERNDFLGR